MSSAKTPFVPRIGFGTDSLRIIEILSPYLKAANDNKYDFVDCAWKYGNEAIIGLALKGLRRAESKFEFTPYFQSKVWPSQFSGGIVKSLKFSLNKIGADSIMNTYFLHRPSSNMELNLSAYKQLIYCKNNSLTKKIGLCNFDKDTINWFFQLTGVMPDIVQYECSVNNMRWDRIAFCRKHNIEIQGHTPYGNLAQNEKNPVLVNMAKKYNVSLKALLVSYLLHHEITPIAVPGSEAEISEIIKARDVKLEHDDLEKLTSMNEYDSQDFESIQFEYPRDGLI
ncbi:aldo/keto reductase family protein [Candidatus Mycoplasma haematolamae str. Purdue]|uniref:Aldo/keto reductase family protein n=1 Tax=Mycoplasma haematolamae (strain Purdue) TaxID=1212765 RepID=I7B945_MYCHA|nr:aldo/keto reductase [Candidatus Mycoplasma haematolamae]AFO51790.1 aldo/keto reductase family protein [Candidatus Mycoplasma haematolamae str. Purdue]